MLKGTRLDETRACTKTAMPGVVVAVMARKVRCEAQRHISPASFGISVDV
jgi:hypothetical protein